jgi:phosphate transport system substrate-binding protein
VKLTSRRSVLSGVIALSILATACGSDTKEATSSSAAAASSTVADGGPTSTADTASPPDTASSDTGGAPVGDLPAGEVFVTGSSTVEPISVLVSELAETKSDGGLAVTVEGPGTGDGFKKFCAGEADIADASRTIKDEEAKSCADAGIEYVELAIAIDGLTVATNPKNTAVECLDVPALYALMGPESEGFKTWKDASVLATELGSKSVLPDAPLTVTGPGSESGTYDSFVEFAVKKLAESRTQDVKLRADYTASPNDNVIVEGIEATDTSLGWVGYAYYEAQKDKMKALGIDGGKGCVVPTAESIADGSYPFSRTLYMYVGKKAMATNPAIGAYVDLYLSSEGLAKVTEAGYVALPTDKVAATTAAWTAAKG